MNVQQALHSLWSSFACNGRQIPACVRDQIPKHLQGVFPIITYPVEIDSTFNEAQCTAFLWMQECNGKSINEMRMEVFNQVESVIPSEGLKIECDDGFLIVDRANGFLSTYNPDEVVDGKTVYGGRIAYRVRFYR